jgi:holo-[acyl-carrier protein] synthase
VIVGIGVDVVEIGRMAEVIRRQGENFLRRVFTPSEQEFCRQRKNPVPHYAARFAAKEALFKAIGTGWAKGVTWQDVEVQRGDPEAPVLILSGEAGKRCRAIGGTAVHISLSHSEHWAVAVVILENRDVPS